jgi:lysozyme
VNPANRWLLGSLAGASLLTTVTYWEGTKYTPYYDIVGVLTVCNGYTGPDIVPGRVYGKDECDSLLRKEVTEHGLGVLRCTKVPLNQNQYDAFASFAYNVGVGAYCRSTLVKKLNAGDYQGACDELLRWNKAGGKEVRGLTRRRVAERELCMKPVTPPKGSVKHVLT